MKRLFLSLSIAVSVWFASTVPASANMPAPPSMKMSAEQFRTNVNRTLQIDHGAQAKYYLIPPLTYDTSNNRYEAEIGAYQFFHATPAEHNQLRSIWLENVHGFTESFQLTMSAMVRSLGVSWPQVANGLKLDELDEFHAETYRTGGYEFDLYVGRDGGVRVADFRITHVPRYSVYQYGTFLISSMTYEEAVAHAKRFDHSYVYNLETQETVWDNYPSQVYQYNKYLGDFGSLTAAYQYARQFDHAAVVYTNTGGEVAWHNWAELPYVVYQYDTLLKHFLFESSAHAYAKRYDHTTVLNTRTKQELAKYHW